MIGSRGGESGGLVDWSHAYDEPHGGGKERKTWKDADVMVRVVRVYHQWCPQLPLLTSPEGVEEGWGGLQMMLDQSTSSLVGLLLWLNTALGFSRTSISAGSSQSQTLTLLTPRPWLLSLPQIKNAKVKKCQTLPHRFLFHMWKDIFFNSKYRLFDGYIFLWMQTSWRLE